MTTKKIARKIAKKIAKKEVGADRRTLIPVYFTDDERRQIVANAKAASVPLSIHIRQMYFQAVKK